jgi:hypothetical protein
VGELYLPELKKRIKFYSYIVNLPRKLILPLEGIVTKKENIAEYLISKRELLDNYEAAVVRYGQAWKEALRAEQGQNVNIFLILGLTAIFVVGGFFIISTIMGKLDTISHSLLEMSTNLKQGLLELAKVIAKKGG